MPAAIHKKYPHGLSEATDCNGPATAFDCSQEFDVGMWNANGANGQLIVGLRALDMVIVIKDFGRYQNIGLAATPFQLWPIVRPAVVALDPKYASDDAAFCEAFDRNRYAPDLRTSFPK